MHLKTDLMRSYLDGELAADRSDLVYQHLAHCPACREKYEVMRARTRQVQLLMERTAPGPADLHRSPHLAFSRFRTSTRKSNPHKEIFKTMINRKPFWTALAVVAILAVALSITPVRAWAGSLLSLFRVEKITVVQFDPSAASQTNEGLSINQEAIDKILKENLQITKEGDTQAVSTADEAAAKASFTPRIPSAMVDTGFAYQPGMQAILTIDRAEMQAVIDAMGADVQLPEEVDGKAITVNVPDAVLAASGTGCSPADPDLNPAEGCTVLLQLPSPIVDAPEGLDIQKIGAAMFQFLGLSPEEAQRLSQRVDWTSTLILPIPQDQNIQVSDLAVDDVSGTLLIAENQNTYTLLWVKEGILYALRGQGGTVEAQSVVNTLP